jgi:hypothetical protein
MSPKDHEANVDTWRDLAEEVAETQARLAEADEQRELAERLLALVKDFLDLEQKLFSREWSGSDACAGAGFGNRVDLQHRLNEQRRRVREAFEDAVVVTRDYAHVLDVAHVVEGTDSRVAVHRNGVDGLVEIAERIRRGDFPKGKV